jgi:siroheme synthase-like protein
VSFGYPIIVDIRARLMLIVGGGTVAVRKAQGVIAAGAQQIRCVAPMIQPQMPAIVERVLERFEAKHLDGAGLAFAATDRAEVNEEVVRAAHERGVWVNRADLDDGLEGDFTVPAVWRNGELMLAVSASGSPALAAGLRDDLGAKIERGYVEMAGVMQLLRPEICKIVGDVQKRRQIFRSLAGPEALEVAGRDGASGVRDWLAKRFPELGAFS